MRIWISILLVIVVYLSILNLAEAGPLPSMNFTVTPEEFVAEFPVGIPSKIIKQAYGPPRMVMAGVFKDQTSWMYYGKAETFRFDFVNGRVWDVIISNTHIKTVLNQAGPYEGRCSGLSARCVQNLRPIKYHRYVQNGKPSIPIISMSKVTPWVAGQFLLAVTIIVGGVLVAVRKGGGNNEV